MPRRTQNHTKKALNALNHVNDIVHEKKQLVNDFLDELNQEFKNAGCPLLKNSHFLHVGSSYEGSAIHPKTDIDIPLIERHEPGIYKLVSVDDDDDDDEKEGNEIIKQWTNKKCYLKLQDMKDDIFHTMSNCLYNIRKMNSDWDLKHKVQFCSIGVTLRQENGEKIKLDMVPALKGYDIEDIPGTRQWGNLPSPLENRGRWEYYTTLTPSPRYKEENDYHLLGTTAFGEMEKACLRNSDSVKNAVRLTKLLSREWDWKNEYNLKSFHIKRTAIKHYDTLEIMDNWDAFMSLLEYLAYELREGEIDGYFIEGQNVYEKDEDVSKKLRRNINKARRSVEPLHLYTYVKKFQDE